VTSSGIHAVYCTPILYERFLSVLNAKCLSHEGIPGRLEIKLLLLEVNIGWRSVFWVGGAVRGYVTFFWCNLPYGINHVRHVKAPYYLNTTQGLKRI